MPETPFSLPVLLSASSLPTFIGSKAQHKSTRNILCVIILLSLYVCVCVGVCVRTLGKQMCDSFWLFIGGHKKGNAIQQSRV